jgi:arylsulfatase A-like enzyme
VSIAIDDKARREFLKAMAVAVGGLAVQSHGTAAIAQQNRPPKQPNLVFFLGEGMRWDEWSFAGNNIIQTPNFDRIAREGVSFRNSFCINSLCSPSRATALTGMYSHSTGVVDIRPEAIPETIPTVADILRDAGYAVGMFGKVHVHELEKRKWDRYLGIGTPVARFYNAAFTPSENGNVRPPKQYDGYFDDVAGDQALVWMNQQIDRGKPFCLFLWFMAPHMPFYRARRHADLYNGVPIAKPATFDDDLKGYPGKPYAFTVGFNKLITGFYGDNGFGSDDPRSLEEVVKDHYAGVVATDDNAGKIMRGLEKAGALDDTAILLSSDHGFFLGEWGLYNKMLMHEPSIRVPLAIRYPHIIKAGTGSDKMVLNLDVAPTMLELAGITPPEFMQGRSVLALAKGTNDLEWRKDWLYEYYDERWASRSRGIRTEKYKLIDYWDYPGQYELYDLETDPHELNNLSGNPHYADVTELLKKRLHQLRVETNDRSL